MKNRAKKESWQSRESECSQGKQNLAEANSIHLFLFNNRAIDFYTASKVKMHGEAFDFVPGVLVLSKVIVLSFISAPFCGFDLL